MEGAWNGSEGDKGEITGRVLGVGASHSVCSESAHQCDGGVEECGKACVVLTVL